LRATGTNCVTQSLGEVTDLADVDGDIRVVWAGGNGEWMPLVLGDRWNLQEQPLTGLVAERRLGELDLDDVCV
jgi:hypothetical protein